MEKYNYDNLFANKVSYLCCNHYTQFVKKTGKPQSNKEWTVLAAVVVERCGNGKLCFYTTSNLRCFNIS